MIDGLRSQAGELHADALALALDAIGTGDRRACSQLHALADANVQTPSVVWLDEVVALLSGDADRARRRRHELDDLLETEALGGAGIDVAMGSRFLSASCAGTATGACSSPR